MGEGMAWFASQHGRNRYERSRREHSHSVPVRAPKAQANRAKSHHSPPCAEATEGKREVFPNGMPRAAYFCRLTCPSGKVRGL
jgi:hypothetical protein